MERSLTERHQPSILDAVEQQTYRLLRAWIEGKEDALPKVTLYAKVLCGYAGETTIEVDPLRLGRWRARATGVLVELILATHAEEELAVFDLMKAAERFADVREGRIPVAERVAGETYLRNVHPDPWSRFCDDLAYLPPWLREVLRREAALRGQALRRTRVERRQGAAPPRRARRPPFIHLVDSG